MQLQFSFKIEKQKTELIQKQNRKRIAGAKTEIQIETEKQSH